MTTILPTSIDHLINPADFLKQAIQALEVNSLNTILSQLPIVSENDSSFDPAHPEKGWQEGKLHWVPLGRDRGNAGRIKLATRPENPLAERAINSMEALIELARRRELALDGAALPPMSPREAVKRYFNLPPLDQLPKLDKQINGKKPRDHAREVAKQIRMIAAYAKASREFSVIIEDDGIGQSPLRIHETLLSLGSSDKGDKPYLIGLFGQGGSSAYAASEFSWCISRRAMEFLDGKPDGVGWTAIRQIFPPKPRRDPYYAYLAAHPSGQVLHLPVIAAESIGLKHGTRFAHLGYNFGGGGSAVLMSLYRILNHILYNPVLPLDLDAGGTLATVYGNGYRLSNATAKKRTILDKTFTPQPIVHQQSPELNLGV